ncbi:hypothetical protein [Azospirillum sp. SYSU D00513]|uniref:hypothetical protein n=1 Tax=Azospirillum sp. SYSU D00513 TaxID=2812561 RepID=UPI001A96D5BA|nr:hypothetical protein [Azospirillum sp. SYSU D00513]
MLLTLRPFRPPFRRMARAAALSMGLMLAACASDRAPAPPVLADAAPPVYDYPFTNPWAATVLGTPAEMRASFPATVEPERRRLTVFEDRKVPDGFWYHDGLYYTALLQERRAPLAFVIAGTGADDRAEHMLSLGRMLHAIGMHVVLLPSPTHANFVVTASSSYLPGRPQQDAADLLRVMRLLRDRIGKEVEISDHYLTGYSLGAWNAAYTAKLDQEQAAAGGGGFGFKRVLLINPPASLYRSVTKIDGMLYRGLPGGINQLDAFLDQLLARLSEAYENTDALDFGNEDLAMDIYRTLDPSDERLAAAIGLSFRLASANMVFASDVMSREGYIYPRNKPFLTTTPLSEYFAVALRTSFLNYFDDVYTDHYRARTPGLTAQALIDQSSLSSIGGWLAAQPQIGLMTNADDVILAPGDLEELRGIFGARARIFPTGGHVGNLEHRAVTAHVLDFFTK